MIKLFGWPISSACYRACVALDLKGIHYEPVLMGIPTETSTRACLP